MTADRIWGLIFIVTGVAMAWSSWQITAPFRNLGDPGPGLLPLSLGIAMAGLGALLALRRAPAQAIDSSTDNSDDGDTETVQIAPPGAFVRVAVAAVALGYVAVFPRLGFTLATLPFLLLSTVLLGRFDLRGLGLAVIVATTATLLVGWVLAGVVGLPLPGVLVGGR